MKADIEKIRRCKTFGDLAIHLRNNKNETFRLLTRNGQLRLANLFEVYKMLSRDDQIRLAMKLDHLQLKINASVKTGKHNFDKMKQDQVWAYIEGLIIKIEKQS